MSSLTPTRARKVEERVEFASSQEVQQPMVAFSRPRDVSHTGCCVAIDFFDFVSLSYSP